MNDLRKFYKVNPVDYLLYSIFFIIMLIVGIFGLYSYGMIAFLIPLMIGISGILLVAIRFKNTGNRELKKLEERGILKQAEREFSHAFPFLNDKVYFGETLLFGELNRTVVEYSKIKIMEFVSSYSDQSNSYSRRAVLKCSDGKDMTLCGCSHREADALYGRLIQYNAEIEYRVEILDPDPEE